VCVLFLLFTGYYLCPINPTTTTTTTLVWASNSPYQQQHLKSYYYYYILNTTYPAGQDRRQQQFSQLFCKPLWCSQCSCFMKLSLIRYQSLPEVIWPLWSNHGSTSWPTWWHWGPFCSSFVFLFCYYQLNLIVKLLSTFLQSFGKKDQKEFSPPISVFLSCLYIWDGIRRFSNSFSSPSVPTTAHFREVFATTTTTIYYTATSDWLLSKWRSRWSQRKCNLLLLLHFHFHFLNHCRLHHV